MTTIDPITIALLATITAIVIIAYAAIAEIYRLRDEILRMNNHNSDLFSEKLRLEKEQHIISKSISDLVHSLQEANHEKEREIKP